jgi:dephospho-CoA kinase
LLGFKKMKKLFAVVGMCGSGKSEACDVLEGMGWVYIRFGQLTIDRLREADRAITADNERSMREELRREFGMGAYALLSLEKIEEGLTRGSVVIDGLYSWSEYKILKEKFPRLLTVVHIYASPSVRYRRLEVRWHAAGDEAHRHRPLSPAEAKARDYSEIENLEKGGPIAMADHTICNESTLQTLKREVMRLADS